MSLNIRSQVIASLDLSEDTPLGKALNEGTLRIGQRYRDFTLFLDLKKEHHKDFLSCLYEHVEHFGYTWEMLRDSELERKSCAESFLEQYGMLYWGSEANREMYLMGDSIAKPEMLCTYPDTKKEITRVLMMLLEKKARSFMRNNMASAATMAATPTNANLPSKLALTEGQPTGLSVRTGEKSDHAGKRRAVDDPDASPSCLASASTCAAEIRPFSSIACTGSSDMGRETVRSGQEKNRTAATVGALTKPRPSNGDVFAHNRPNSDLLTAVKNLEKKFGDTTRFIVSASTQPSMAPVWVPFRIFQSASLFLAHMADECELLEWDPSAQLNCEISKWDSTPPVLQAVVAASVKFDWSGLHMRVRRGRNEDWTFVLQELLDAWKTNMEDGSEGGAPRFHIHVMLHVG